jgi:ubiquinol-cytochrome c reductase cytochrome b subunit
VFVAAIVVHLLRIFFTGAFRKPRDLTYYVGCDADPGAARGLPRLLDRRRPAVGMGLAIGYSVLMSIPFVGANLAQLIWGGPFPAARLRSRMYIAHVLSSRSLIGALIALHLRSSRAAPHAVPRPRATETKVVGIPTFPGYAPRSLGLAFAVAAVLVPDGRA